MRRFDEMKWSINYLIRNEVIVLASSNLAVRARLNEIRQRIQSTFTNRLPVLKQEVMHSLALACHLVSFSVGLAFVILAHGTICRGSRETSGVHGPRETDPV